MERAEASLIARASKVFPDAFRDSSGEELLRKARELYPEAFSDSMEAERKEGAGGGDIKVALPPDVEVTKEEELEGFGPEFYSFFPIELTKLVFKNGSDVAWFLKELLLHCDWEHYTSCSDNKRSLAENLENAAAILRLFAEGADLARKSERLIREAKILQGGIGRGQ